MLGFTLNDVAAAAVVYAYVAIIFYVVENVWKGDKAVGRKILHISMGNIVFLLWIIETRWAPLIIAGSFVVFSLLITHRMQQYFLSTLSHGSGKGPFQKVYRKVIARLSLVSVSEAGNEFGLVYYCVMYAALAVLFYQHWIFVAVGMLPLAFGDGLGAVVGRKYGVHKYKIADLKSVEGSLAVFAGAAAAVFVGVMFYSASLAGGVLSFGTAPLTAAWKALLIGAVVMVVEAIAPRGLDNLAIPISGVLVFYLLEGW